MGVASVAVAYGVVSVQYDDALTVSVYIATPPPPSPMFSEVYHDMTRQKKQNLGHEVGDLSGHEPLQNWQL